MKFDWPRFLKQHRIEYVTSGPNTSKGNWSVRCPFCGEADPSQHMGISLSKGWWGCLRNAAHRGKNPARLVQQLLRCSPEEAKRIVGVDVDLAPTADDFTASVMALKRQSGKAPQVQKPLQLMREFKPLMNGSVMAQPFVSYLEGRGYRAAQIKWLAEAYKLHYATMGDFAHRLIVPIHDRYGELLSWTARAISPHASPRYKTLRMSSDYDEPIAKLAANNTVLGLPVLWGANNPLALIVVEGPFDSLKLTAFGHTLGAYATCLFGLNVYPAQVAELQELARHFERIYLLIDDDAELHKLRLMQALAPLGAKPIKLFSGVKDPGDLSAEQVVSLCLDLISR